MSEPTSPTPEADQSLADLGSDDLVVRLRQRVEERRAEGAYPAALEQELDAHFLRIVHHRETTQAGEQLAARISELNERLQFVYTPAPIESGVPGVSAVHKATNKALARNNIALFAQLNEIAVVLREALTALAEGVQTPTTHHHGDILNQLDGVIDRLESYERAPVDSGAALGDIRRRLDALEQAQARA